MLDVNDAPEDRITVGEANSDDINTGKVGIGNASGAHAAVNIRIEQGEPDNTVFERRYHLADEEGVWFEIIERDIYHIRVINILCEHERAETIKPADFGCFRVEGGDPSCIDSDGKQLIKINEQGDFYRPSDLNA